MIGLCALSRAVENMLEKYSSFTEGKKLTYCTTRKSEDTINDSSWPSLPHLHGAVLARALSEDREAGAWLTPLAPSRRSNGDAWMLRELSMTRRQGAIRRSRKEGV